MKSLLAIACALLATVVALELGWEGAAAPLPATPAGPPANAAVEPPASRHAGPWPLPPLERYADIVERPLFEPMRRPARSVPDAPRAKAAEAEVAELRLAGVLYDSGRRLALMRDASTPWLIRLRPGESLGGWTLAEVRPDAVVVSNGTERRILMVGQP